MRSTARRSRSGGGGGRADAANAAMPPLRTRTMRIAPSAPAAARLLFLVSLYLLEFEYLARLVDDEALRGAAKPRYQLVVVGL